MKVLGIDPGTAACGYGIVNDDVVPIGAATGTPAHLVARDALVELGYSVGEAEQALAEVDPDLPPEDRIRLVLRSAA